jgi:uncharacterized membrane protein
VEGGTNLRDDELKLLALALIGLMAVVAIYPILDERRAVTSFSELGILGPNKKMADYPKTAIAGQIINLYLYVGNHEGEVEYFRVLAKLGDSNSIITESTPLNAPAIASWDCIIQNERNSTLPIKISMDKTGLNQCIVFELYIFNPDTQNFVYHQRWVQLWLDVTSPLV